MHVTICSYEFDRGAEGICTGRLTRALLKAGCHITVVTSPGARTTFECDRLHYRVVSPTPIRPAPLFFRIAQLLGHIPTRFYIWSRRVATLRLPCRPDLVYGRAYPLPSTVAAHGLAARYRRPLWTHFSDPIPSPWWDKSHPEFERTLRGARRLAQDSQALTLTTPQAVAYQESLLQERLERKAFVLNHVAPEPALLPARPASAGKVLAYFGLFYGERRASALLEGFRWHLRHRPEDVLLFVGTEPASVLPDVARLGLEHSVRLVGRVDDVRGLMSQVDILVAIDAFSRVPAFLSTKLIEYLVVNRPVLLLSPGESPGAELVTRFPLTTTLVTSEHPEAVGAGLARSTACAADEAAYLERFSRMEAFSPQAVANRFLEEAKARNPSWTN